MNRTAAKTRGFSLIEMMVTLAIMAILAMIAIPSFRNMTRRNQVTTSTNRLLADLSYAKTEAVSRGLFVSLCPSSDGETCQTTTTYDTGWIVYAYSPGNAKANTKFDNTSPTTNLLLRYTQAQQGVSITGQDNSTNNDVISFDSQGQQMPSASAKELDFVVCYRDGTSGVGTSTSAAQGSELVLMASGGLTTKPWPVGSACTPS